MFFLKAPENLCSIFIMQLCQFSNQGCQLVKNGNFFSCSQSESNKYLTVPTTIENEVSFTNKCSLIVTINHSGTLNSGHYQGLTLIFLVPLQIKVGC